VTNQSKGINQPETESLFLCKILSTVVPEVMKYSSNIV